MMKSNRDYSIIFEDSDGSIIFEDSDGVRFRVYVEYYYPGTNFIITSASLEPNDDPEVEYSVYLLDSDNDDDEVQVYDDDGLYDPEMVEALIHEWEAE